MIVQYDDQQNTKTPYSLAWHQATSVLLYCLVLFQAHHVEWVKLSTNNNNIFNFALSTFLQ
jgi:hypothetical protein